MTERGSKASGRGYNRPLQVVGYIATQRGDEDRGPLIRMRAEEARTRLVDEGELVWVIGPRGRALAPLVLDETVPRGGIIVRDLPSLAPTDIVRVIKPDFDHAPLPPSLA